MSGPIILPWRGVYPRIASDAFVAPGAVVIGDVEIGSGVTIWFGCVLRGDVNYIRVGDRTNIQDGTVVHVSYKTHPTIIGAEVLIGHMATIHGCTLEDKAFIGMRATVMDGAVVEREGMVAAGALIAPNKRVPQRHMWAGSPARYVREVKPEELANFALAVDRYAGLGAEYSALLKEEAGSI